MGDNRNFAALEWVTQEIDETLAHAREALESWANDPNDSSKIRFCLAHIHQVHGSLQMVEFYGAALLAEELEHLAQALCDERVQFVVEAQEALMRGILQLPIYLDRIKTQRRDQPAVLLPLLNDLRSVRGDSLLSESRLFNPDLTPAKAVSQARISANLEQSQYLSVQQKLQQMYQFAAAALIRGVKPKENSEYLHKVLSRQYKLTTGTLNQALWEVALALLEALDDQGLELSAAIKLLLRQLNREMKVLLRNGVAALERPCDEELLRNLLFYVAIATSNGRFVSQVRQKYQLDDDLLGSDDSNELSPGHDPEAIRSVVNALKEELRSIKLNLDDCLSSDSTLECLHESLPVAQRVADTLAILGVGDIRKQMLAQVQTLETIISSGEYNDQQLFDMAADLIDIEGRLDALTRGQNVGRNDIEQQKAVQLNIAQEVVLAESRNGLEQTKDCIIEYIASQWDRRHLQNVPKLLREIRGGLDMIPLARAGSVLGACAQYIDEQLLQDGVVPEWRSLDTLADAIASIEYYLEHLSNKDSQSNDEVLLAVAEDSIRSLGLNVEPTADTPVATEGSDTSAINTNIDTATPVADNNSTEPETEATDDTESAISTGLTLEAASFGQGLPEDQAQFITPHSAADVEHQPELDELSAQPESEDFAPLPEPTLEYQEADLTEDTSAEAPVDPSEEPEAVAFNSVAPESIPTADEDESTDDELIDEEILEIFIEEAEEVSATIDEYYPRWVANLNDAEALTEFRRAFHTLKGSGRMVGASDIGELAWSIENMLNRVIDKTISPSPLQVELINRVLQLLPTLINAFKHRSPNPEVALCRQYMAWADEIASGGEPEALAEPQAAESQTSDLQPVEAQTVEEQTHEHEVTAPPVLTEVSYEIEAQEEPALEDEDDDSQDILWEIFSGEANGHLATIGEFIAEMDRSAPIYSSPSDPMQRALHTLKGSAHMADVQPIAQLATPLENFVKELRSYQYVLDDDLLQLIKDGVEYIRLVLDQIAAGEPLNIPRLDQFVARISEQRDRTIVPIIRQQDQEEGKSKPVDPELLSIFMAEEMNLLLDADVLIERWRQGEMPDAEVTSVLQEVQLLEQGATHANHPEMAQLSGLLQQIYSALLEQRLETGDRLFQILERGHEDLLDMVDAVAAGQNLPNLSLQLRADIELLLETLADAPELEAPSIGEELPDTEPFEQEQAEPPASDDFHWLTLGTTENTEEQPPLPELADEIPEESDSSDLVVVIEDSAHAPESESNELPETSGLDENALDTTQDSDLEEALPTVELETLDNTDAATPALDGADASSATDSELELSDESPEEGLAEPLDAEFEGFEDTASADTSVDGAPDSSIDLDEADLTETGLTETNNDDLDLEDLDLEDLAAEIPTVEEPISEAPTFDLTPPAQTPVLPEADTTHVFTDDAQDEEIDPEIIEIFSEEAAEILEEIDAAVHEWTNDWEQSDCLERLKRSLHTFKGSARLAGIMGLGEAAHDFESMLIKEGTSELGEQFFANVNAYYELLYVGSDAVQKYLAGETVPQFEQLVTAGALTLENNPFFNADNLPGAQAIATQTPDTSDAVTDEPVEAAATDEPTFDSADGEFFSEAEQGDTIESGSGVDSSDALNEHEEAVDQDALDQGALDQGTLDENIPNEDTTEEDTSDALPDHGNVVPFAPRKTLQEAPIHPLKPITHGERISGPPVQSMMGTQIAQRGAQAESVKVSADLLEELVNLAGETSISRSRMEEQVNEIGFTIDEMDFTIERLQEQLRRLDIETEAQILFRQEQMQAHEEFDPLEMDRYSQLQQLSRSLMESASDLLDLKVTLSDKARDTETLLLQQSRINTELQEGLMRSRMVPFSRLIPRLRRIVRQVSSELGKRVTLELDNVEGELDRTMLERMIAPLEHMVRNAIDHGIELPDQRVDNGKPEAGVIRLGLNREGGDVILHLSDDGRGIDIGRVREKAIERGLMSADAQLSDHDIMQFILTAGFSTATSVTQISGRGVGMDVVNSEIKQLGGSVSINSVAGQGSEFVMRLPFTLSVNRALMVSLGDDIYAVPLNSIEGIVRVSPYELEHYYETPDARFEYAGQQYQVRYLGTLLDENYRPQLDGHALPLPVLLVRSQEYSVALQVDSLLGSREIVVKSLGPQFASVDGLSGATVMGDGSVVVILDLLALVRRLVAQSFLIESSPQEPTALAAPEEPDRVRTVMIVDDSVTVRKVTSRFLEREGFDVMTAKDGVDALRQLQENVPDIMLLDIEMPRMDGFEVAKNIRTSSHLHNLPIIMITSRTGSKHRERAYELGVNNYLGKPYQEDELLASIKELIFQGQSVV